MLPCFIYVVVVFLADFRKLVLSCSYFSPRMFYLLGFVRKVFIYCYNITYFCVLENAVTIIRVLGKFCNRALFLKLFQNTFC